MPLPRWFWPAMLPVAALLHGCESVTVAPAVVAAVEIDPEAVTLVVEESESLTAVARASSGSPLNGREVTWMSLDPDVATVDSDGVVRGLSTGTATIQATVDGVTGIATILVTSSPAIVLSESAIELSAEAGDEPTGTHTVIVRSSGDEELSGLETSIDYGDPGPVGWLQVTISSTVTPATLSIRGNPSAVDAGLHLATVTVSSSDPQAPPGVLEVAFHVDESSPEIVVSSSSVSLAADQGREPPTTRQIDISNGGDGALTGLRLRVEYLGASPTTWLEASLSGTVAPAVLSIGVDTDGLSPGVYDAVVELTASSAPGAQTTVLVRFRYGDPPPEIELGADDVTWAFPEGTRGVEQRVAVENKGAGTLGSLSVDVSYPGGPEGWLLTAIGSTAPTQLVLSVVDPGFVPGTYRASVQVRSPDAINSPQRLDVAVSVRARPSLERSTVMAAPAEIPADGVATALVTVRLLDPRGAPISSDEHAVIVGTTRGTVGQVERGNGGEYTAVLTSSTAAGVARIGARVDGQLLADSATVTFTAPPPPIVIGTLTASPSSIAADGTSTSTVTLQIRDILGNPTSAPNAVVVFATTLGTIGPITNQGNGLYTATLTSATAPGIALVTATVNGIPQISTATVSFTAAQPPPPPPPSPAVTGTLTASPTSIAAGGASSAAVSLQLRDAQGNPTTGSNPVVVLATTAGTLGAVANQGNGLYAATLTSSVVADTAVVSATVDGVVQTSTATVMFTATQPPPPPPPAVTGTLTASPTSIVADGVSTSAVSLQLRDAQGNPTAGSNPVVAFATTGGTLGSITNQGNGLYAATLTSSSVADTAVVTATVDSVLQTSTATVMFTAATLVGGECRGVITGGSYEQVVVPPGASCTLIGVQVAKNVDVKRGASLFAQAGARIGGDLKGDEPLVIDVRETVIQRNVRIGDHTDRVVVSAISAASIEIKNGGSASVLDSTVTGRLLIEKNRGALTVESNTVGGDLQALNNVGVPSAMRIASNRATGKLECKGNSPAPVGELNVAGSKVDQCVNL